MKQSKQIELLAPAGDLEKLKVAFAYGADAVYLAGEAFGLRSAAGNFSISEIEQGIEIAHNQGKKVYLALNTYPNQDEIKQIAQYLKSISTLDLDAVIVADPGVFTLAKELTSFNLHISTQSSVTNKEAVKFWKNQGASRIVLGREVSIAEAEEIKQSSGVELETFIHGSMCMSYSGKCVISNYTANRDANRGGCVNSCRWEYSLTKDREEDSFSKSYVMNSKDLMAVDLIPELINAGVNSLKIEGRMKSFLYLANTVSTYRQIIDAVQTSKTITEEMRNSWIYRLNSNPNRGFSEGFLRHHAGAESVLYDSVRSPRSPKTEGRPNSNYIGLVREITDDYIVLQVKNPFKVEDVIAFLTHSGEEIELKVTFIKTIVNENINESRPNSVIFLEKHPLVKPLNVAYLQTPKSVESYKEAV